MLGELAGSRDGRRRWALVDFTSGSSRDTYEGASSQTGHAGHVEAIRDALRNLAENGGYGRGTLAIRLPQELDEALGQPVTIERAMRSAPGPWARVRQRLTDLATTLEVAALFATGGASLGLSIAGGISGAVVAVDSLARRRRTDHVWEAGTIFDVLGVIGGATSVIGPLARRSGRVDDILRLYGKVDNVQQVISIPAQTAIEIHQVLGDSNLSEGERRSRAALALLKGIRSGAVTIAQMRGGLVAEEGLPPRADDDTGARPPGDETGAGPLPEGHRADDAEGVADGRRPPVPPDRPLPGEDGSGTTVPDERPDGSGRTPSARDLVDEAQQLGRERLRESLDAELRPPEPDDAMAGGRTAAGTGSAGRTGVDEGLDVGAAERARAVELLGQRLGQLRARGASEDGAPPRPGDFGPPTRSADAAVALYDRAVALSAGAEVGLFYNPNTGDFAVRIGTEMSVSPPRGDGWHALVHIHPNPENVITRRLPAPADVLGAVSAAVRTGSHTEFVESTRPDGSVGITRVTVTMDRHRDAGRNRPARPPHRGRQP